MGRPLSIDKRIDRFFSYRPRSIHETRNYLKNKLKLDELALEKYLDKLNGSGLLNDEAFVVWWIGQRTEKRQRASIAIRGEIMGKGVSAEQVDRVIKNIGVDDDKTISMLIQKKAPSFERKYDTSILKQKFTEYLMRRGYRYDLCKRSLEDYYKKM